MTFFLTLLGFGRGIIGWLSKRSLAELASLALALVCVVEFIALKAEKRHSSKLQAQIVKLDAQLRAITTAKNEQKQVTKGNIVKAEEGRKKADVVAKRIEQAPLPGNCATPKEILEADL
jgi:hypothetical protein